MINIDFTLPDYLLLAAGLWLLVAPIVALRLGPLLKRTTAPDVGLSVLDEQYDTLPIECLPRVEQVRRLELLYRDAS